MSETDTTTDGVSRVKRLRRSVVRLAIYYGIIVIVLAFLQRKLIYRPMSEADLSPQSQGIQNQATAITCQTEDGLTLAGWHWRVPGGAGDGPVVLLFHGNGGHRGYCLHDCEMFAECGAETVVFDYRGYGDNPGSPTEAGLAHDARAVWKYATETAGIEPQRLFLCGNSLGGGVAMRLASELCDQGTPPAGIFLRSTFSSMTDTASWHYPWLPVRWVLCDRYPSDEVASRVTSPVLQFHGNVDTIVPLRLGRKLFAALPRLSATGVAPEFVELDGVDHNDLLKLAYQDIRSRTGDFFQRHLAHERSAIR